MSMIEQAELDYSDGRTKQSFKDSTDINKILARAWREGSLSHLEKYQGVYADFSDFDFLEAQNALVRGRQIFSELPSELRKEFNQNPAEFFEFVNNPENEGKLGDIFPELAKPGRQKASLNAPPVEPPGPPETPGAAAPNAPPGGGE